MKGTTNLSSAVEAQTPSNDTLYASIAFAQEFELYRHYTEAQAARYIGIHAATLKKLRLTGNISHIRIGKRRVAYFGVHVAEYLVTQTQICQHTKNVNTNLEITGSVKEVDHQLTTELGSILKPDKHAELHSALRISKKLSNV